MIDICDSCSKNFKQAAGRLRERVLRAIILLPDPAVHTLAANHTKQPTWQLPQAILWLYILASLLQSGNKWRRIVHLYI